MKLLDSLGVKHQEKRRRMGVVWNGDERPSTGNATLDADHKELFDLSGEIESLVEAADHAALAQAFKRLKHCMERHFQNEELLAHALNIPFTEHRLDHENILAGVDLARREIRNAGQVDAFISSYARYLRDWLVKHLNEKDLPMKHVLQGHPYDFKVAGVFTDR